MTFLLVDNPLRHHTPDLPLALQLVPYVTSSPKSKQLMQNTENLTSHCALETFLVPLVTVVATVRKGRMRSLYYLVDIWRVRHPLCFQQTQRY